jgi:hypothetical protein
LFSNADMYRIEKAKFLFSFRPKNKSNNFFH